MDKIEIKGCLETLKRISIFLENNHIDYVLINNIIDDQIQEEINESIDWPFKSLRTT